MSVERGACVWHIGRLPKDGTNPSLSGAFSLDAGGRPARELAIPVSADFRVSGYAVSGLRVASLTFQTTHARGRAGSASRSARPSTAAPHAKGPSP